MGDKGIWKGVSVFGECQLDNAAFQFLKVFWNLGEQELAFVCCVFPYIFMIKNIGRLFRG